jgi:long-chain fatty acid transport protein
MTALLKRAAAVLAACPLFVSSAQAAGYDFNDHGARAIGMGGAHAGLPDDGTAIYYNPAGLTAIDEKLTLQLDTALVNWGASFTRAPEGSTIFPEVEDDSGLFFSPFFAVTYKVTPRLALAIGAHGPPSVGERQYPDPQGRPASQFDSTAPQRQMLISRDVLVAYPGIAAAYQITDWLSVGANLQFAYTNLEFTQNAVGGATGDQRVTVEASGFGGVAGILGATVRLAEGLHLGASWRPRYENVTDGTITVRPYANIPFEQNGEDIEFRIPFPDVIRTGLDWRSGPLHLASDFVFETFSQVDRLEVISKEPISFNTPVGVVDFPSERYIERQWEDSWSVRAGGEYALRYGTIDLTPRLGALYEASAIPEERTEVAYPNWERFAINAGISVGFARRYEVTIGYTHIFQPERDVDNSTVEASESPIYDPLGNLPPVIVGNGTYNASYDIVNIGLRATFDGQ